MRNYVLSSTYKVDIKYLEHTGHIKLEQNTNSITIHDKNIDEFIDILRQIKQVKEVKNNGRL